MLFVSNLGGQISVGLGEGTPFQKGDKCQMEGLIDFLPNERYPSPPVKTWLGTQHTDVQNQWQNCMGTSDKTYVTIYTVAYCGHLLNSY